MALSHSACGPSNPDSHAAGNGGNEDADISSLLGMLASVTDPRSPQGIQHALQFILAVCVVAMLAGAKNYREIAGQAADMPQPLLKKLGAKWNWFRLSCKHPSESTIRNVLTRIDAAELDLITGAWLFAQARKYGKTEWEIAVDGKVMRGAWTDENDKVTLFSAMLHREAVTVAQVRVPDGTNEITQAGTLLDAVKIPEGESALITLDAAHTQRETAEYVGGKPGWDFLMTVKGNQPSLHTRLSLFRRRGLRRLPRPAGWHGFLRVWAGRGCRITRELYLSRHRPDSIKDRYVMSCMRNARTGY